jgi:hypothetical protein
MVLAGGWAPYFLVKDFFDHCGSVDIDFVLKPTVVERYENVKRILERLGYRPTGSVFRFEREVTSPRTGIGHRVEVDFLTDPEGADRLPGEWLASVQQDLKACIVEGCSVVFKHNYEVSLRATMPNDGEARARFNCANIVASLTMKGLALYRMKDKDSYDIYSVAGFYRQGPKQASAAFMDALKEKGFVGSTADALAEINDSFTSETSQGPVAVARFVGSEDARTDSCQRVNAFLQGISI